MRSYGKIQRSAWQGWRIHNTSVTYRKIAMTRISSSPEYSVPIPASEPPSSQPFAATRKRIAAMSSRQEPSSPSLLSPAAYDEDVASLRSLSEQDSDSEDDELLRRSRSTLELAEHDRSVLEEEEETEKLLVRTGPAVGLRRIFSPTSGTVRIGKRERRKQRRRSEREKGRGKPYQEGDLMFEMEEGFRGDDSTQSSTRASSLELDRLALDGWGYKVTPEQDYVLCVAACY